MTQTTLGKSFVSGAIEVFSWISHEQLGTQTRDNRGAVCGWITPRATDAPPAGRVFPYLAELQQSAWYETSEEWDAAVRVCSKHVACYKHLANKRHLSPTITLVREKSTSVPTQFQWGDRLLFFPTWIRGEMGALCQWHQPPSQERP